MEDEIILQIKIKSITETDVEIGIENVATTELGKKEASLWLKQAAIIFYKMTNKEPNYGPATEIEIHKIKGGEENE